jgi:hypothetical protein
MQCSPFSCHLIPLRSKYPPQHPVLKHPQSMLHTSIWRHWSSKNITQKTTANKIKTPASHKLGITEHMEVDGKGWSYFVSRLAEHVTMYAGAAINCALHSNCATSCLITALRCVAKPSLYGIAFVTVTLLY